MDGKRARIPTQRTLRGHPEGASPLVCLAVGRARAKNAVPNPCKNKHSPPDVLVQSYEHKGKIRVADLGGEPMPRESPLAPTAWERV